MTPARGGGPAWYRIHTFLKENSCSKIKSLCLESNGNLIYATERQISRFNDYTVKGTDVAWLLNTITPTKST